jgi:hypothetical protein
MRRLAWISAAAVVALGGCEPRPAGSSGAMPGERGGELPPWDPEEASEGSAQWPFWPRRMRVHPLTRVARDAATGATFIEARIEFMDESGHTVKGVGQVRLDLHDPDRPGGSSTPVATWSRDLRNLPTNARHYDEVTRTYLFRLEVEGAAFPQQPEVRAYFLGADGQRLRDTFVVRR